MLELGRMDDALKVAGILVRLKPDDYAAYVLCYCVYTKPGEDEKSTAEKKKAIALGRRSRFLFDLPIWHRFEQDRIQLINVLFDSGTCTKRRKMVRRIGIVTCLSGPSVATIYSNGSVRLRENKPPKTPGLLKTRLVCQIHLRRNVLRLIRYTRYGIELPSLKRRNWRLFGPGMTEFRFHAESFAFSI